MIRYQSNRQLTFSEFILPFSGALNGNNRWIKLANMLPWDELVSIYARSLSEGMGRPTQDLRIELGSLIIQELMDWDDREVIDQIEENPYLQYFLGYQEFSDRRVFDPSLLVTIRKRLNRESIADLTGEIDKAKQVFDELREASEANSDSSEDSDDSASSGSPSGKAGSEKSSSEGTPGKMDVQSVTHQGILIVDATAAELEIPYPTDLGLLNQARLQSERIIDLLWSVQRHGRKKPRTYRQKAKAAYLAIAKQRRKSRKTIRRGIRQQLQYLGRNIKTINKLLESTAARLLLKRRDRALIETIGKVYVQQKEMYDEKKRRIDDRIVNLYQPWVRPIKRGKSGADVEFGPKLSVSLIGAMAYVDHFSWDAYNEGNYLKQQVEAYYQRYGFYPEVVIADTIYGNRENRRYLKALGIRYSGKKLGRPIQLTEINKERLKAEKRRRKAEQRKRVLIEGRFGVGRRRYGLGRVRTRLQETSETSICMAFFAMSIVAYFAACFFENIRRWWHRNACDCLILRQIPVFFDNNDNNSSVLGLAA